MRTLFGCLAALLCVVSVALAARYGHKGADTEIDGVISAIVFGLIAVCACLFDAAAVRLWFMGHRIGAATIGVIAAAALVVTFTNSLGAIAGRSDSTQAERNRTKADEADSRAELARITRERDGLAFTPATDDAVKAARDAVTTAERIRLAECGNGDQRQRGPNCRQRETEEQANRNSLASVLTNKALTERAAQLDADAARVRAKLAKAPKVQNANPLGAVLEQMIGATAAALTAWQQAIVAGVFELCLVGVMVIYELLGHVKQPPQQRIEGVQSQKTPDDRRSGQGAAATGDQALNVTRTPQDCRSQGEWQRQELLPRPCVARRRRAGRNQGPDAGLSRLVCQGERDTSRRQRIPGRAREALPQARYRDCGRWRSARVLPQRQDGYRPGRQGGPSDLRPAYHS